MHALCWALALLTVWSPLLKSLRLRSLTCALLAETTPLVDHSTSVLLSSFLKEVSGVLDVGIVGKWCQHLLSCLPSRPPIVENAFRPLPLSWFPDSVEGVLTLVYPLHCVPALRVRCAMSSTLPPDAPVVMLVSIPFLSPFLYTR